MVGTGGWLGVGGVVWAVPAAGLSKAVNSRSKQSGKNSLADTFSMTVSPFQARRAELPHGGAVRWPAHLGASQHSVEIGELVETVLVLLARAEIDRGGTVGAPFVLALASVGAAGERALVAGLHVGAARNLHGDLYIGAADRRAQDGRQQQ